MQRHRLDSDPEPAEAAGVTDRRAVAALCIGLGGFVAAVAGLIETQAWLGVVAGTCALLAGLLALDLGDRLRRMTHAHELLARHCAAQERNADQLAARAAEFEVDVVRSRSQAAEAMRLEARQALDLDRVQRAMTPASPPADPVTDPVTGLFNERFFMATLEKRVSAARRGLRPLGLVLLEVVTDIAAEHPRPTDPMFVTDALVDALREADTMARLDDGRFAVLLEDTPETGCVWTIERMRRRLNESHPGHTVWAGLSCYPSHAFEQDHLMAQARSALLAAMEWRQDRIEVALTPED